MVHALVDPWVHEMLHDLRAKPPSRNATFTVRYPLHVEELRSLIKSGPEVNTLARLLRAQPRFLGHFLVWRQFWHLCKMPVNASATVLDEAGRAFITLLESWLASVLPGWQLRAPSPRRGPKALDRDVRAWLFNQYEELLDLLRPVGVRRQPGELEKAWINRVANAISALWTNWHGSSYWTLPRKRGSRRQIVVVRIVLQPETVEQWLREIAQDPGRTIRDRLALRLLLHHVTQSGFLDRKVRAFTLGALRGHIERERAARRVR